MSANVLPYNNRPDLSGIATMANTVIDTIMDWDTASGRRKASLQKQVTSKLDILLGDALKYDDSFSDREAVSVFQTKTRITDSDELGKLNGGVIALAIIREMSSTHRAVIERQSMTHWNAFENRYIDAVC